MTLVLAACGEPESPPRREPVAAAPVAVPMAAPPVYAVPIPVEPPPVAAPVPGQPPPSTALPPSTLPVQFLLLLNGTFNLLTYLLGPLGTWLRGSGRNALGWAGILMLAAAGVWAAGEWAGYEWPAVDLSRMAEERGIHVLIGSENPVEDLRGLSLITSTYTYRDQVLGVLGVVGPRRMPYSDVMAVVDETARIVSSSLSRVRQHLYLP